MENQELKEIVLRELPNLIQNTAFKELVLQITQTQYANKVETESRFDRMMDELVKNRQLLEQKMREDQKKWEENNQRWRENNKQWEENSKKWEEHSKKWDENDKRWEESNKRWEENNRKWEENNKHWREDSERWWKNDKRWEENHKELVKLTTAIQRLDKKYDQTLGALGTRWGLHSEETFRKALSGILADFPGLEIINVNEYDDEGIVFGHPDQVELDLIIKNGVLIICEIKSSMSKSDMYAFDRKVNFYEKKHHRHARRRIVISPMVDLYAKPVAEKLNIEIYSYVEDVKIQ